MLNRIPRTGSAVITSSAETISSALAPPPTSQKFAGLPPAWATTSSVDMTSPAPLPEDADVAVELHVREPPLPREPLLRRNGVQVPHFREVGMAEERVVVERHLRVERPHLALRRDDERVHLAEHRLALDERPVELLDDRRDLLLLSRGRRSRP